MEIRWIPYLFRWAVLISSNWNAHFDFAVDTEHKLKRLALQWIVEFTCRLPGSCLKLRAILPTLLL